MSTAAMVSRVGTSPQHAMTTSGTDPASFEAKSQTPSPRVQCTMASSGESQSCWGCLPATMTLT